MVLGAQWGDEGKGKLIDYLVNHEKVRRHLSNCLQTLCVERSGRRDGALSRLENLNRRAFNKKGVLMQPYISVGLQLLATFRRQQCRSHGQGQRQVLRFPHFAVWRHQRALLERDRQRRRHESRLVLQRDRFQRHRQRFSGLGETHVCRLQTANQTAPTTFSSFVSNRSHIVLNIHQQADGQHEGLLGTARRVESNAKQRNSSEFNFSKIGTTNKGIGPTYSSKCFRNGVRMCELMGDFSIFTERYNKLVDHYVRYFPNITVNRNEELEKLKVGAFSRCLRIFASFRHTQRSCARSTASSTRRSSCTSSLTRERIFLSRYAMLEMIRSYFSAAFIQSWRASTKNISQSSERRLLFCSNLYLRAAFQIALF